MYTHQQTFDMVCKGLRLQNQIYTPELSYRSQNGNKCIIGVLVPEGEYYTEMEGYGIERIMELKFKLPSLSDHNFKFLVKLQRVHDTSNTYPELDKKLKDFADAKCLKYTTILNNKIGKF